MLSNRRCVAAGLLAFGSAAQAGTIIQSGVLPLQTTDWSESVSVNKFDSLGGSRSLVEVHWQITGFITGYAQVESLDAGPTSVGLNLSSNLSLSSPSGLLGSVSPLITASFNASAFDGVIDFAGASGASIGPLTGSLSADGLAADVTPFIGTGTTSLNIDALAASWCEGSGNVITGLTTDSSLAYSIEYSYQEIPTPGAIALCGIAGLTMLRRRR